MLINFRLNLRKIMVEFITIGCVILVSVHWTEQTSQFLSDERIEYINKIAKTWKVKFT